MEYSNHNKEQTLEGLSDRDILEVYSPEQLLDYKSFLLDKYSVIESQVNLINDILDGYGYTRKDEYDNIVLGED